MSEPDPDLTTFTIGLRIAETGVPFPYAIVYRAPMNTVRQIARDFTGGVKTGVYTVTDSHGSDARVLALRFSDVLYVG